GASELVRNQFKGLGSNVILVLPASQQQGGVRQGTVMTLTESDTVAIAEECPSVLAVSPLVQTSGQVIGGNVNWSPKDMIGVGPDFLIVRNWPMQSGEFFTPRQVAAASNV